MKSIKEVQKDLADIVEQGDVVIIGEEGKELSVVIPASHYHSLLRDAKELLRERAKVFQKNSQPHSNSATA